MGTPAQGTVKKTGRYWLSTTVKGFGARGTIEPKEEELIRDDLTAKGWLVMSFEHDAATFVMFKQSAVAIGMEKMGASKDDARMAFHSALRKHAHYAGGLASIAVTAAQAGGEAVGAVVEKVAYASDKLNEKRPKNVADALQKSIRNTLLTYGVITIGTLLVVAYVVVKAGPGIAKGAGSVRVVG